MGKVAFVALAGERERTNEFGPWSSHLGRYLPAFNGRIQICLMNGTAASIKIARPQ